MLTSIGRCFDRCSTLCTLHHLLGVKILSSRKDGSENEEVYQRNRYDEGYTCTDKGAVMKRCRDTTLQRDGERQSVSGYTENDPRCDETYYT